MADITNHLVTATNFDAEPKTQYDEVNEGSVVHTIFMGNLSIFATRDDLLECCNKFGDVLDAKVIHCGRSNKNLCYGFSSFKNYEEASQAIKSLNNQLLLGRPLKVGWAAHQMNPTGNFIADSRFRLTEANLGLQTGQPGFDSSYDRGVDDDNSSLSSISIDPQLRQSSSQNPSDDINFGGLKISQNTPLDDHNNTNFNMLSASVHFNYFVDKSDFVVTEETLRDIFEKHGEVSDITLKKAQIKDDCQEGYGFVHFYGNDYGVDSAIKCCQAATFYLSPADNPTDGLLKPKKRVKLIVTEVNKEQSNIDLSQAMTISVDGTLSNQFLRHLSALPLEIQAILKQYIASNEKNKKLIQHNYQQHDNYGRMNSNNYQAFEEQHHYGKQSPNIHYLMHFNEHRAHGVSNNHTPLTVPSLSSANSIGSSNYSNSQGRRRNNNQSNKSNKQRYSSGTHHASPLHQIIANQLRNGTYDISHSNNSSNNNSFIFPPVQEPQIMDSYIPNNSSFYPIAPPPPEAMMHNSHSNTPTNMNYYCPSPPIYLPGTPTMIPNQSIYSSGTSTPVQQPPPLIIPANVNPNINLGMNPSQQQQPILQYPVQYIAVPVSNSPSSSHQNIHPSMQSNQVVGPGHPSGNMIYNYGHPNMSGSQSPSSFVNSAQYNQQYLHPPQQSQQYIPQEFAPNNNFQFLPPQELNYQAQILPGNQSNIGGNINANRINNNQSPNTTLYMMNPSNGPMHQQIAQHQPLPPPQVAPPQAFQQPPYPAPNVAAMIMMRSSSYRSYSNSSNTSTSPSSPTFSNRST